jgi:hypothetical protein
VTVTIALPVEVFCSYSHKDDQYRQELAAHLSSLARQQLISTWYDREIAPGTNWEDQIDERLNSAALILLLISPDFLASDYCYEKELRIAIKRHDAGDARVIPIILRPVDWNFAPLNKLQVLPTDGKPVSKWDDRDDAYEVIARSIRTTVEAMAGMMAQTVVPQQAASTPASPNGATSSAARAETASGAIERATARHCESVRSGLLALVDLMDLTEFRAAVASVRAEFADALDKISVFDGYKRLHDCLHTLQFDVHLFVLQEIERTPDEGTWINLRLYEQTMRQTVSRAEDIAGLGTVPEIHTTWIEDLAQVDRTMAEAIEHKDPDRLRRTVQRLDRVCTLYPTLIDTQMMAAAAGFRLPTLAEALEQLHAGTLSALQSQSDRVQSVANSSESLSSLHADLAGLVHEHNRWQAVDAYLRLLQSTLQRDAADLDALWPSVKEQAEPLFQGRGDAWAETLRSYGLELEASMVARDPGRIRSAFGLYRRQVGLRFFEIDHHLLGVSEQVRTLSEPLALVLRRLNG